MTKGSDTQISRQWYRPKKVHKIIKPCLIPKQNIRADIFKAASELQYRGKKITFRTMFLYLKQKYKKTTISCYLTQWRKQQRMCKNVVEEAKEGETSESEESEESESDDADEDDEPDVVSNIQEQIQQINTNIQHLVKLQTTVSESIACQTDVVPVNDTIECACQTDVILPCDVGCQTTLVTRRYWLSNYSLRC